MTADDLSGRVVALSLSPPGDIVRLGYPRGEFDRLCFELALRIVRAGGRVLYGGHLHEGSMTLAMFEHIAGAYAAGRVGEATARVPFLHFLSWHELAKTPFDRLARTLRLFGTFAETRVLPEGGEQIRLWLRTGIETSPVIIADDGAAPGGERAISGEEELAAFHASRPPVDEAAALGIMRDAQRGAVAGRVVLGGRRGDLGIEGDRYGGAMPGICEEVLVSIEAGQPVALAAAFGGAARDAAVWLGLLDPGEAVPFLGEAQPGVAEARERLSAARDRLRGDREVLSAFARRDDTEALARDLVAWVAGETAEAQP